MKLTKAVITLAAPTQRSLPLQTLMDRDGAEKSVLAIILGEVVRAGIEEICLVVSPGDEAAYARAAGSLPARLRFVAQPEPRGYGNAILCARDFTAGDPFLHLVGDHLYISCGEQGCARAVVEAAEAEACAVSAVQATRESLLPRFGAVGGKRISGRQDLYRVETVIEKPTPTEAEQHLVVPGLRAGYYLCFFGIHVLTPAVMDILADMQPPGDGRGLPLSPALAELARREQYLAFEKPGNRRYDLGARYGLLTAQLALALAGQDRDEVLAQMLELLALREMSAAAR
ncbi:MAG TPA: sugar phosphate nucleotidyltransferase [Bryobacteraceae bacterium]|nr:sugar phosphate nucleotidyltransferase [Bryobacteraceae bacterium]